MNMSKFVNDDAEREVLGAIMLDNKVLKDVVDILAPEDFYVTSNSIIYATMKKLYIENSPIDVTTIYNELGNKLEGIGGITYLSQLASVAISSVKVLSYCTIVKERSNRRNLCKALNVSMQNMQDTDMKVDELIDNLQNEFRNIDCIETKKDSSLEKPMGKYLELIQKRVNNKGYIDGYTTGLKVVDKFMGGFQKQDLVILAARPSMGKSAVAINMAANMAMDKGIKVALFHLEMNKMSTIDRIIASRASIPMNSLKKSELNDEEWTNVINVSNNLASSNLFLYDEIYNLKNIRAECKRLKLQKGLEVVFIDYLQLIEYGKLSDNKNDNITQISRGLKLLAKELDITVVALSQLSRAPETRSNHRPLLSDLRDSGSIEQDADMVIFLYRDEYYDMDSKDKDSIEFIVAKHRNGETGTLKIIWQGKYQRVVA